MGSYASACNLQFVSIVPITRLGSRARYFRDSSYQYIIFFSKH